jgi:hypothetical protein
MEGKAAMSSTNRTWDSPVSFAERIWPVIDVYGRLRPLVAGEAQRATTRPVPRIGVFAIA